MGALSPCHPPPRTWHTLLPHSAPSYHPPKSHLPPGSGDTHFSEAQTLVPGPGSCRWGEGGGWSGLFHSGNAPGAGAGRRRSWVLSRAPGWGSWSIPQAQTRVGVRAPGGLWAGLGSAQTSPQVLGCDPAQRGAAGAPALCAPAPAAQLLRMTSSHLPPPAPQLPAGWRRGGVLGVWGLRQEVPGAAGRCSPRTA